MPRRTLFPALLSVAVVAAVTLAACGPATSSSSPQPSIPAPASAPADPSSGALGRYYQQKLNWQACTAADVSTEGSPAPADLGSYQCATIQAPLDWDNPDGDSIDLRIAVHRADGQAGQDGSQGARPALFFNLGGPGGAAVSSMSMVIDAMMGQDLVNGFDVVGLDPRGVGASTPVICMTDQERDVFNSDDGSINSTDPAVIIEKTGEIAKKFGEGCLEHSGDVARHIDTISAAKDFDMARALMGQQTLNYLGYSYGTFLGATYADLFPQRVGRMVLDGALDPALNTNQVSDLQMRGIEDSLHHWIEDCQSSQSCPLTGDVNSGIQQVKAFLDRLADAPLPTSDPKRPLTQSLAITAIVGAMYSTDSYANLTQGMQQAIANRDGSVLLILADFMNDRSDDGTYRSNSGDALMAINSLDYPPAGTPDEWIKDAQELQKDLPILGQFAGYTSAGLEQWPIKTTATRKPITAEGTPPILVIGTTHDPATPYVMAQNLAKELSSGQLLTWDGWNHTAYSATGSACIANAVEGFFIDGTQPEQGLTCSD